MLFLLPPLIVVKWISILKQCALIPNDGTLDADLVNIPSKGTTVSTMLIQFIFKLDRAIFHVATTGLQSFNEAPHEQKYCFQFPLIECKQALGKYTP